MVSCFSDKATLTKLISFKLPSGPINIARKIGTRWREFGPLLLADDDAVIVPAIDDAKRGVPDSINLEILQRWIRGEGIRDRTWRGLLGALEAGGCKDLATEIKQALLPENKLQGIY